MFSKMHWQDRRSHRGHDVSDRRTVRDDLDRPRSELDRAGHGLGHHRAHRRHHRHDSERRRVRFVRAYVATRCSTSARTDVASGVTVHHGNLMTVPYNNRAGGTATPITGAATSTFNEYYPTFSPDDTYVAYNRVADGASSYNNDAGRGLGHPDRRQRDADAARRERSAGVHRRRSAPASRTAGRSGRPARPTTAASATTG